MPVSPADAELLAREVVGFYSEAETLLLTKLKDALAKGRDAPDWAEKKLGEIRAFKAQASEVVDALREQSTTGVQTAITKAYEQGGLSAVADLMRAGEEVFLPINSLRSVDALVSETMGFIDQTHPRILRAAMDDYRSVVAEASQQVLLGTQTLQQSIQRSLDGFAQKGITGFTDKRGRRWSLESYTEAAMRTGVGRAAVQGHADRLAQNGWDLVIGSDAPKECPLCRPWEGTVMSVSGNDPDHPSLNDARAAGWQHVNCRHSISLYQEGVTPPMHNTEDPQGYEDTKKLRYLERKVRESKRLEAVAIDDDALRLATRRKLDYQAKIRHHVATTKAKRQPWRESFGVSKKKLAAERAVAGQAAKVAPKVDRFAELATKRSAKTWATTNKIGSPVDDLLKAAAADPAGPEAGVRDFLTAYQSFNYEAVNAGLRSGRPLREVLAEQLQDGDPDGVITRALEALMTDSALPKPVTLFRGIPSVGRDADYGKALVARFDDLVGETLDDGAFISTTLAREEALSTDWGNVIFHLKAPAGTRGVHMAALGDELSESEFLLAPGTKLRVAKTWTGKSAWGADTYHIEVEVVQ